MFGQRVIYEGWSPKIGVAYFYPSDLGYGKVEAASSTFNSYGADRYKDGLFPTAFANEKDALEASRRMLKVLNDYHEELGY